MTLNYFRRFFPITAKKIYMNHAAISPMSTRVTEKLDWYIDERSFGLVDIYPKAIEIRESLRGSAARLINTKPENIAFISNTSEGFNILVHGLEWQQGDQIILTDYEFPSNIYPFKNLESQGVEIVLIPNRDGIIELDDIIKAITPRTKLLSISFVEFSNGFRNDLEAIGKICKEHGIIFSVDGIQGLGGIQLDVQKYQIDFLSNGGHKWLMGTMGAGLMFIHPELFRKIKPQFTGWLAVENAWDFFDYKLDFLPDAKRFEYATGNFLGITALSASIGLLLEAGPAEIENHLLTIGAQMVEGMEAQGLKFLGSRDKKYWSGIYSFAGKNMEKFQEYLLSKDIVCALRNGNLRVSPHFYNTSDEVGELIRETGKFYSVKS